MKSRRKPNKEAKNVQKTKGSTTGTILKAEQNDGVDDVEEAESSSDSD